MKNRFEIYLRKGLKRYHRRLRSKQKRAKRRAIKFEIHRRNLHAFGKEDWQSGIFLRAIPTVLLHLIGSNRSDFFVDNFEISSCYGVGIFDVPENFSIVDNGQESYLFLSRVTKSLLLQEFYEVRINYENCVNLDIGAQVFLDIILKDIISFYKKVNKNIPKARYGTRVISGVNTTHENVQKLIYSVGSPVILNNRSIRFKDIIPYQLCVHNRAEKRHPDLVIAKKDVHTTQLVDYVLTSLARINKFLPPERIEDLCIVISEILINAEEHSSTNYRFSIGYFQELNESGKHYGIFRLAILNFGKTIYEKFADPHCPNQATVKRMRNLSKKYIRSSLFKKKIFVEETLWTLYSLQEGITTVRPDDYRKRGNGSIRFIDSFFKLKGDNENFAEKSKLSILSGNTSIIFDGTYAPFQKTMSDENFTYMTFNDEKSIEKPPDSNYVKWVDNYFPGTIISAKIFFNDDDFSDANTNDKP